MLKVAVIVGPDEDVLLCVEMRRRELGGRVFARTDGYTEIGTTEDAKSCVTCLPDQQSAVFTWCRWSAGGT